VSAAGKAASPKATNNPTKPNNRQIKNSGALIAHTQNKLLPSALPDERDRAKLCAKEPGSTGI
jgi:hypothetical protein